MLLVRSALLDGGTTKQLLPIPSFVLKERNNGVILKMMIVRFCGYNEVRVIGLSKCFNSN